MHSSTIVFAIVVDYKVNNVHATLCIRAMTESKIN
jgi:hypothetical protein